MENYIFGFFPRKSFITSTTGARLKKSESLKKLFQGKAFFPLFQIPFQFFFFLLVDSASSLHPSNSVTAFFTFLLSNNCAIFMSAAVGGRDYLSRAKIMLTQF